MVEERTPVSGDGEPQALAPEVVAAVRELRVWAQSLPVSSDEVRQPQRDVALAIVEALMRRLLDDASAIPPGAVAWLRAEEGDLHRTIDQVGAARDAAARRLATALPQELAIGAVEQLNDLVDDLVREAMEHALRDLRSDAFTDSLTGAANRRSFERDLHRMLEIARRHERELAVAVIDLDGLKRINDSQGHAAGDQALRDLSTAFLGGLRAGDGFYRIGGDEFALVLAESGGDAVDALLARTSAPSFSYGWAAYPKDGATTAELLQAADSRLLEGRLHRGGRVGRPAAPVRASRWQLLACSLPILVALVLAEMFRRAFDVQLGNILVQSWIGLLAIGAILGPPVAQRWCSGHQGPLATMVCASRIAVVILIVCLSALVPVHRLRDAIDTAAAQHQLALERQQAAERARQGRAGSPDLGPTSPAPSTPLLPGEGAVAAGPLGSGSAASTRRSPTAAAPVATSSPALLEAAPVVSLPEPVPIVYVAPPPSRLPASSPTVGKAHTESEGSHAKPRKHAAHASNGKTCNAASKGARHKK